MSTRTERLTTAGNNIDITLRTFLDTVMQSSATDIEKAKILQAQRLYSAATRTYIRAHLGLNGDTQ